MDTSILTTPLVAMAITAMLWLWSSLSKRQINQHQDMKQHYKLTRRCLLACLVISALSYVGDSTLIRINFGMISTALVLYFLSGNSLSGSTFWSKTRNRVVAGSLVLTLTLALALGLRELSLLPVFIAILITHLNQKRQTFLLELNLEKVSTLQAKLYKQAASLHNEAIYESSVHTKARSLTS